MNGDMAAQLQDESAYMEAFTALGWGDELEGDAAIGIYAQLTDKGEDTLSKRQIEVVKLVVDRFCDQNGCELCGNLELDDFETYLETGYCSWHNDQMNEDND
jgi:hypothetical protein